MTPAAKDRRGLSRVARFTASVRWEPYATALADLMAANALTASEPGVRLRIPLTAV